MLVRVEPSLTKQMSADFELAAADCVCTPPWVQISTGVVSAQLLRQIKAPLPILVDELYPSHSSARRIAMWFGVPNCLGRHEIAIAHGVGGESQKK